jgi:hypothetical protein
MDPTLAIKALAYSLLLFAILPGAVLRLLLLAWPKDDPVRAELRADLEMLPFRERPFFVASQIPNAVCDGLGTRVRSARRSHVLKKAARLDPAATLLTNSEISWLAPNGDLVPVVYDAAIDEMTFETTPYFEMLPRLDIGDECVMVFRMDYHGPSIRPTWRAQLLSKIFRRPARRRQHDLGKDLMTQYVNQLTSVGSHQDPQ